MMTRQGRNRNHEETTMYRFNKRNLKCSICGRGFNEHCVDHLCVECYELASIDNMVNDSGGDEWNAGVALQCGQLLAAIAKKGGDVAAARDSNDFIKWDQVPSIAAKAATGRTHGDNRATNGVKAPVTVRYGKKSGSYKSLFVAFGALGLPMNKMQKFRVQLKLAGELTFDHEGTAYHFTAAGF